MGKNTRSDEHADGWKEFSLLLLLILGVVGAFSYSLLLRQKERLDIQEVSISNLTDKVNSLFEEVRVVEK